MNARGWVTLSVRLLGLGFVLVGVVKLIAAVELASSPQLEMVRRMSDQALEGALAPNYLGTALWMLLGALLMGFSAAITRFLFLGLERNATSGPSPGTVDEPGRAG
jgi:hypothetical protein